MVKGEVEVIPLCPLPPVRGLWPPNHVQILRWDGIKPSATDSEFRSCDNVAGVGVEFAIESRKRGGGVEARCEVQCVCGGVCQRVGAWWAKGRRGEAARLAVIGCWSEYLLCSFCPFWSRVGVAPSTLPVPGKFPPKHPDTHTLAVLEPVATDEHQHCQTPVTTT